MTFLNSAAIEGLVSIRARSLHWTVNVFYGRGICPCRDFNVKEVRFIKSKLSILAIGLAVGAFLVYTPKALAAEPYFAGKTIRYKLQTQTPPLVRPPKLQYGLGKTSLP